MRWLTRAAIAAMFAAASAAPGGSGADPVAGAAQPRLILLLGLDQFGSFYLEEYSDLFEAGFTRLLREGRIYHPAEVAHAPTLTWAGFATLSTGAHPSHHGIVSHRIFWTWPEQDSCGHYPTLDPGERVPGFPGERAFSGRDLKVTALADWVRAAHPDAISVAIGQTHGGVPALLGGQTPDGGGRSHAYWLLPDEPAYVTSSFYRPRLPAWVERLNAKVTARATHGSAHAYDRRVPIVLLGPGVVPGPARGPARTVDARGVRGEAAAIAEAEAMVQAMGGTTIWAQLKSLHLVHEWFPWQRIDSYVENEILDLTGPRSRADRKSEINHALRAYSPEGRRWSMVNGELSYAGPEELASDLKRAPFNFFRLVRGVAARDPYYEVRFGEGDIPGTRRLEFYGPDRAMGGWIILNARKEPIVKATPEYRYTLGPLKRFGNLWVPAWGVYDNGTTRYQMLSLTGDNHAPDSSLFRAPEPQR